MTRKDFELIAKAIADSRMIFPTDVQTVEPCLCQWQRKFTATMVADALASDNPRFDRDRFLKACGVAV